MDSVIIREVDFERADVTCPSTGRPYWKINLYNGENCGNRRSSSSVDGKLKKEEKWVVE